jgi:hypothetical protein
MPSSAGLVRSSPCGPHHVHHAGGEAEQEKRDEAEGRCRQQAVETPAEHRTDKNAGDQLGRKPKTARHRRCSGCTVSASSSRLLSPGRAAVTKFGQPLIETPEPCGKRSLIGRLTAIPVSAAVVRAFRHDVKTDTPPQVGGNCAPSPFEAARTILTASSQVKIACGSVMSLISIKFSLLCQNGRRLSPRRISVRLCSARSARSDTVQGHRRRSDMARSR